MLAGEQAQGYDALRPDRQMAVGREANVAVTTQPNGVDVHRLDHRPPPPHLGALLV